MIFCECLLNAAITFQALAQCTACEDEQLKDFGNEFNAPISRSTKEVVYKKLPTFAEYGVSTPSKVKFAHDEVILIPCLAEIFEETSKESLWYDRDNFSEFRASAIEEATICMYKTGAMNVRRAFSLLYQPESFMLPEIPTSEWSFDSTGKYKIYRTRTVV